MKVEEIVKVPNILLPKNVDMSKWAVIACDQFTSQVDYWKSLDSYIGTEKSTKNLIFPEVYLSKDNSKRIDKINNTMKKYLDAGVFEELGEGFVLVDRNTPYNEHRLGLILSIDLEKYSFGKEKVPVRATEGTIIERIPPRVKIRENAKLEFPHIMLLIDDKDNTVIKPLYEKRNDLKKLYDFDLNQNGGHITGYFVEDTKEPMAALQGLIEEKVLKEKYGDTSTFLFAVGDGNHSLATAKTCWDNIKAKLSKEEFENHPARYCLVEVVNLYDDALKFEPIHRLVKNVDAEDFMEKINGIASLQGADVEVVVHCTSHNLKVEGGVAESIKRVDEFINSYKEDNTEIEVDYIHGEDNLLSLVSSDNNSVGILLDKIQKETLFKAIAKGGALNRKSFSMGEAEEKRYYIEAKKIK